VQSKKDAEAVSMMRKMRVTWTSDEDSLVSTVFAGCVIDFYYSFVSHLSVLYYLCLIPCYSLTVSYCCWTEMKISGVIQC